MKGQANKGIDEKRGDIYSDNSPCVATRGFILVGRNDTWIEVDPVVKMSE